MRDLVSRLSIDPPGADRPRRLRARPELRALVRETRLAPAQLVAPLFVVSGHGRREEISSLPGHGPVAQALRLLRGAGLPLALVADVCLCEYTTHGHCGVLDGERVDNDLTLPRLAEAAITYADAGADIVGPSAMMDGQVAALRDGLDQSGHTGVAIMAYASKAASALYGPFRDAAGSTPGFGDRRAYQMDFANGREALREMDLDAGEGADFLMVKPALTSLDLLARARDRFDLPLAAYQVSGEAAMIEAAAERGWIDRRGAALETLTAIVRAGADVVITYFAADAATWLGGER